MISTRPPLLSRRRQREGFTLTEVLIALGVLAIGSVGVASLFPTAALLQRDAVRDTLKQNHIRSSDAVLEGVGLDNRSLLLFTDWIRNESESGSTAPRALAARAGLTAPATDVDDPSADVFALAEVHARFNFGQPLSGGGTAPGSREVPEPVALNVLGPNIAYAPTPGSTLMQRETQLDNSVFSRYALTERSLPTSIPGAVPNPPNFPAPNLVQRELFWVPFVRRGFEASDLFADWLAYAFVMQPDTSDKEGGRFAYDRYDGLVPNGALCANPTDPAYVPKVFRIPVTWNSSIPNVANLIPAGIAARLLPGETVLGDNGVIYRISEIRNNSLAFETSPLFDPIDGRDLTAIWLAPATLDATTGELFRPRAEVRQLSNSIIRAQQEDL